MEEGVLRHRRGNAAMLKVFEYLGTEELVLEIGTEATYTERYNKADYEKT